MVQYDIIAQNVHGEVPKGGMVFLVYSMEQRTKEANISSRSFSESPMDLWLYKIWDLGGLQISQLDRELQS